MKSEGVEAYITGENEIKPQGGTRQANPSPVSYSSEGSLELLHYKVYPAESKANAQILLEKGLKKRLQSSELTQVLYFFRNNRFNLCGQPL